MKLDITTVGGLLISVGSIVMGTIHACHNDIPLIVRLFVYQPEAILIVGGGSVGAIILAFPGKRLKIIGKIFGSAFKEDTKNNTYAPLITEMVDYATEARRNGVLSLDAKTAEISDPFIKTGIQLAVDGTAPDQIEEILHLDVEAMETRHTENQAIILKWAELAPGYGMVGTLIGMVAMLANLSNPDTLGPAFAIALVTTLYGAAIANMFALPIACKLAKKTKDEVIRKQMIIAGVLAIQNGDNPRIVQQKLLMYLPVPERAALQTTEE